MLSILKKKIGKEIAEDDTCSICFDTLEDPTLTPCGTYFVMNVFICVLKLNQVVRCVKPILRKKTFIC